MWGRLRWPGHERLVVAIVGALAAVLALLVAVVALSGGDGKIARGAPPTASATPPAFTPTTTAPSETAAPTPTAHPGLLDGLPLNDEQWAGRKDLLPLAVMVDNTTGAYPQSGLDRADLVYEAFVEGGITRLMAVYWSQDAESIIPVRSARTPFVVWASELGALYAHAGGAITENEANAVGQIQEWGIRDLNAFSPIANNYYYRDQDRPGPYNLATSTAYLREAADQLGFAGPSMLEPWRFREPGTSLPGAKPAGGVEVVFHGGLYSWQYIQWKWDPGAKRYLRFQFGGPHVDARSGDQLAFATVIVMRTQAFVVDENGHVLLDQLGSGPATVFTGGQAFEGSWKKDKRESRTRFYNDAGDEIVFERGPIWFEVVAQQSRYSFVADPRDLPSMPEYVPPPPGLGTIDEEEPPSAPATQTPLPSGSASPAATQTPFPTDSASRTVTRTPGPSASPSASGSPSVPPTPSETVTPQAAVTSTAGASASPGP